MNAFKSDGILNDFSLMMITFLVPVLGSSKRRNATERIDRVQNGSLRMETAAKKVHGSHVLKMAQHDKDGSKNISKIES